MGLLKIFGCLFIGLYVLPLSISYQENSHGTKEQLTVALLWPKRLMSVKPSIPTAFKMGVEHAKQILKGYDIEFDIQDTDCNPKVGMKAAVQLWKNARILHGIIGSICSIVCEPVGLLSAAWNIPQVSYYCSSSHLTNKNVFPTFSRVVGTYDGYAGSIVALLRSFKWTRFSIITDTSSLFKTAGKNIQKEAETNGIDVFFYTVQTAMVGDAIDEGKLDIIRNVVADVKKHTRVTLLLLYGGDIRIILVLADQDGSNIGQHAFLGLDSAHVGSQGEARDIAPDLDDAYVFHGMITIANDDPSGPLWDSFYNEFINRISAVNISVEQIDSTIDKVTAGLAYDAVLLWARGVNKTIGQGYSPSDGVRVTQNIINSSSQGATGNIVIDENGDRLRDFKVTVWQNGKHVKIMHWNAAKRELGKVYKPDDPNDWFGIRWSGNATKPPTGVPVCGWHNELCQGKKQNYVQIYFILISVLLFFTGGIALFFWQYRKKRVYINVEKFILEKSSFDKVENRTRSHLSSYSGCLDQFLGNSQLVKIGSDLAFLKTLGSIPIPSEILNAELMKISTIKHENVNSFLGICLESDSPSILMLYAPRGSLYDVLHQGLTKLSTDVKQSLTLDVALGMNYLHNSNIDHLGCLSSRNCVVDFRWICKVTDYTLHRSVSMSKGRTAVSYAEIPANKLLWIAPEHLNSPDPFQGSKAGDVYSFGVILQEVTLQDEPYALNQIDQAEIIDRIKNGDMSMKPDVPDVFADAKRLIDSLCSWSPHERPSFKQIARLLQSDSSGKSHYLVDKMIARLEVHTQNLESIVEARTTELFEEKNKTEFLLQELLPQSIIDDFMLGEPLQPQTFKEVTMFYSDIVSFTKISAAGTPMDVVKMLNSMYTLFDDISAQFDVYKVATIGDAYFVASGVPVPNGTNHAREISYMALALLKASGHFVIPHLKTETLKMRIGIHSGPCVAGVVGMKTPRYLLFGDTVDITSKMESTGAAMKVHISETSASLLKDYEDLQLVSRDAQDGPIKGLENLKTFWLEEKLAF